MTREFEIFKDKIFALGSERKVDVQIIYLAEREFQVRYQNGQQDQYTDAGKFRVQVQVLKNGKLGTSYTETLEDPEKVFMDALENISIVDTEDVEYFYDGSGNYPAIAPYDGAFENLSVKQRLGFVEEAEKVMRKDERIIGDWAVYGDRKREWCIANSLGLDVSFVSGGGFMYAVAIAKDVSPRSGAEFILGKKPEDIDPVFVGEGAREWAVKLIGSKSIKSGKYRVILLNEVFSDILGMLVSMISAENAHKNMSPLRGKIGERVASEKLTIKDLPYHPLSISNLPFDTQGVPTREKIIIENGVFKTFLHNLKTAKKDGVEPTGNAYGTAILPINLVVEPGEKTFDQLLMQLGDGIVIVNVEGLHSGANPISGNFSLSAKGLRVENGEITHGVEQITISGNFLELLKNIEELGTDVRATMGMSSVVTPSVLVSELDIAGAIKE